MAFPLPAAKMHVADGLKVPVLLVVRVMVPVGLVGLEEVSTTLTVQVVTELTSTEPGEHATVVVVELSVGETGTEPRLKLPLLMAWVESPLYPPAIRWCPVTAGA